jgi:peptide deformylase
MVLPIKKFPKDSILRQKAKPVEFPLSPAIKKLTKDMIDTVKKADGIGLAAPQVGHSVKLVIINLDKNGIPTFPLYNAKVVSRGFKKVEIEEGCLSIPGVFGNVKRPQKVTIEAQNALGEKVRFTDDGWIARVAQHEIDHTDGILILDYIKKYTKGEELVREWEKQGML